MSKSNTLKVCSKSVAVIGVTGICLFLSEPTFIKAENLQSNNIKVQDNQVDDNLQSKDIKSNNLQDNSFTTDNLQTDGVKSNNPQNPQDQIVNKITVLNHLTHNLAQQMYKRLKLLSFHRVMVFGLYHMDYKVQTILILLISMQENQFN